MKTSTRLRRRFKKLWYGVRAALLTVFGDIKVFKRPMFAVYDPGSYKVKGRDCRAILNGIEAGDVLLRGYDCYLDGYFIPVGESGCSHSGLFVGGNDVVHSIAEGVTEDDLLDFCRADRVVVLRALVSEEDKAEAVRLALSRVGRPYDFDFTTADTEDSKPKNDRFYCHEFTRYCYPRVEIEKMTGRSRFLGIKGPEMYLADSFYTSPAFVRVYEGGRT